MWDNWGSLPTGPPAFWWAGRQATDKGLANPGFLSYNRYGILTTGGFPVHYLDNSATTPVLREAAERAFQVMTADFGNPSSQHTNANMPDDGDDE